MHTPTSLIRRHWLARSAALALGAAGGWASAQPVAAAATPTLDKLRERGRLVVGLYNELPPFHVKGQGIEVELAQALAKALGLQASLLPFNADENMNDDLRNMVWRGHYLGHGPADVLLHVPVDAPLMASNPKVKIFAPYYRERVVIARDVAKVPTMPDLSVFKGQKMAVPGQSLAGWLLIGAEGGAYREQLLTKWADGTEAARALQRGEVVAAAGHASELESVLAGDARFAIEPLPLPRMRDGWAVGCAVKAEATDLAQALQAAMNQLASDGSLASMFGRAKLSWRQP
ncbi:substrate-binding periplasmic protein [Vitreoscilla filiformis]|nr:transporter substrate-binding domain-containing protein [Vitreoscilla filiformis]